MSIRYRTCIGGNRNGYKREGELKEGFFGGIRLIPVGLVDKIFPKRSCGLDAQDALFGEDVQGKCIDLCGALVGTLFDH